PVAESSTHAAGPGGLTWGCADDGKRRRERRGDERHTDDRGTETDEIADATEHGPADEAEHGEPEDGAERLAATLALDADGHPGECAGPGRGAREDLEKPTKSQCQPPD